MKVLIFVCFVLALGVIAHANDPDVPGQQTIWNMNGNTIVDSSAATPPYFVAGWKIAALCDLDGDGVPDRLWWNETLGLVVPWLMNADGTIKYPVVLLPQIEHQWKIVGCAKNYHRSGGVAEILWNYVPDPQ